MNSFRFNIQTSKKSASFHPLAPGFDVKINLNGFLILNSGHRRLSFTYLHNFEYSTNSLIGEQLRSAAGADKPKSI